MHRACLSLSAHFYKLSKKPYTNCTKPHVQSMQFLKGHNAVNWKLTFSLAEMHLTSYSCFCSLSQLSLLPVLLRKLFMNNSHKDFVWRNRKLFLSPLSSEQLKFHLCLPVPNILLLSLLSVGKIWPKRCHFQKLSYDWKETKHRRTALVFC